MFNNQKPIQEGFTLIELVVVIVILGILAATAIPKFIDLQSDASTAAAQGVAAAVSSGFATNYAAYVVNSTKATRLTGAVTISAAVAGVLGGAGMPAGYAAGTGTVNSATASCATSAGGSGIQITVSNTVTTSGTFSAAATLICTG